MESNITFSMIKPKAVKKGYVGPILTKITEAGFQIVSMKYTRITRDQAESFYGVHKDRPFFADLVEFMTSGPIVAMTLLKDNAVADFRTLVGATDPTQADPGTIRRMFADSIESNAVHGSDSDENAEREAGFFFSGTERFYVDLINEDVRNFALCEK